MYAAAQTFERRQGMLDMTDDNTSNPQGETGDDSGASGNRTGGGRRWLLAFALVAAVAATAFALPAAFAGSRGGGSCAHGRHAGPESPAETREKLGWMADKLMKRVDGTDAQKAKVDALLDQIAPNVFRIHTDGRALREQLESALLDSKGEIDAAELESIRAEGMKLADEASKRAVGTLTQLADILTPEQREELAEDMQRWRR